MAHYNLYVHPAVSDAILGTKWLSTRVAASVFLAFAGYASDVIPQSLFLEGGAQNADGQMEIPIYAAWISRFTVPAVLSTHTLPYY